MSVIPCIDVCITQNVGKTKELKVPVTIFSTVHPDKSLQTTAVINCRASTTFIHWMFVWKHGIKTPFQIRNADGEVSQREITHYCPLAIKINDWLMVGKFNVMNMSDWDMILLGKPWLSAMNPNINWAKDTLQLPTTKVQYNLKKPSRGNGDSLPLQNPHHLPRREPPLKKKKIWRNLPLCTPLFQKMENKP